ncbi:MAG: C1 family peptidase, partial [Clostridiaceae bacterium]|nr:C1 family peptidase [Clostridiaceae bacterium]
MTRVLQLIKKAGICFLTASMLLSSWQIVAAQHQIKDIAEQRLHPGVKPLSTEDRQWMHQNMAKLEKVQPNIIGLERVNSTRKKKGLQELSINKAAPLGKDVVIERTPEIVNQYSKAAPASVTDSVYNPETYYEQTDLQPFVDNSTLPYFPPIRHQGTISSCTSFSTAYYQATHMIALANGWDTKDTSNNSNKFSPKWAYNLINDGKDNGTSQVNAYRLFMEQGIATWNDFPYDENFLDWPTNSETWQNASLYKPDKVGYLQIWDGSDTPVEDQSDDTLNNIKQLLNNGYVLSFNTVISDWIYKPITDNLNSSNDNMLVGRAACYMRDSDIPGDLAHAMTIVGYCDDVWVDINNNSQIDRGELGAFKIANSWGSSWGIDPYTQKTANGDGFIWLCYDALNKVSSVNGINHTASRCMAIDEYNTAFWMTVKAPEPPSLLARIRINHSKRNQLKYELGYSEAGKSSPDVVWTPYILNRDCGGFSFDGTEAFSVGTVVLDFSNLILNNNVSKAGLRWYIRISDTIADGSKGLVESVELINLSSGTVVKCPVRAGRVIDGTSFTVAAYYRLDSKTNNQNSSDSFWSFKDSIDYTVFHNGQNFVESGGRLFLYGTDKSSTYSGMLLEYDPSIDNWFVYDKNFKLNSSNSETVSINGKIYFVTPGFIDIYDITSRERTFFVMPESITNPAVTVCNNKIYIA